MNGSKAFREGFMYSGDSNLGTFSDFDARRMRYAILWSHYENNSYRDINTWAQAYKATFGLYRYTRSIYSPAYRIAEFWKAHLWGGQIDPEAGDGTITPSALPIITDNEALRDAIAQVFLWSNWQVKKNVFTLKSTVLGDGVLKIVDDTDHERVYLKSVHPGTIKSVETDETGNIKAYYIEETRKDMKNIRKTVTYGERATRNGDMVIYETFLNGKPYAWPDNVMDDGENASPVSQWEEPYGFIPMVILQHNDVGLEWGWSELQPVQSKVREADDLASKLSDQIRKAVEAPMLLAGVSKPIAAPRMTAEARTTDNPEPGREEMPFLYGPTGATAHPLYSDLNIQQSAAYIQDILKGIENDYPELRVDPRNITGELSGRALRELRRDAEDKVTERRPLYDDSLVRGLQMSISIAGMRGYQQFTGFNLDSFEKGDLKFKIGKRPVFTKDVLEDLENESMFWDVAAKARNAGMSIPLYLEKHGWEQDDIDKFIDSPEYKARLDALKQMGEGGMPDPKANQDKRNQNQPPRPVNQKKPAQSKK